MPSGHGDEEPETSYGELYRVCLRSQRCGYEPGMMSKDFYQNTWSPTLKAELKKLLELALREDCDARGDLTSRALIAESVWGAAAVTAREDGVLAGSPAVAVILQTVDPLLQWNPRLEDGAALQPGSVIGEISGPVRSLLTAERIVLNLMGRLSGIATLTKRFTEAVDGTVARIYDTRKTTLGWRRLEKYAVRCGGGRNHRTGLFDAVLIKDNHLAFGKESGTFEPADAVRKARAFLNDTEAIIEIEVDTLEQLQAVLPAAPDIVLLDNMSPETLKQAVEIRNGAAPDVELEASGGVNLSTVRAVAESGVERISVGALTHSAIGLDLGLDWK